MENRSDRRRVIARRDEVDPSAQRLFAAWQRTHSGRDVPHGAAQLPVPLLAPSVGRRLLKRKFVRVGPATESPSDVIKAWVTTFRGKEVSLADCPHVLPMSPRREQRHDRLLGWIGSELVGIQWSEPQQCLILTDQRRLGQRGEPNR